VAVSAFSYHGAVELRHLHYFVVVAEELHFRRAAERLHIAQPSVSQQVRRLEDELGVQLFERNRRGVTLTPAGSVLLDEARATLAQAARAADRARAAGAGERGRLRVNLTRSLPGGLAGAIVDTFRERYPEVQLELDVGQTSIHAEQLRRGAIDIAFIRPPLHDPELEEVELGREPLVCVLPSNHRLARQKSIERADIADEPLVFWRREHGPGAWDDMLAGVYGDSGPPKAFRAEPEEERIVSAVAGGAGISFIMLERSKRLKVPGAVYRRFAPPEPTVGIGLAWRRGNALPVVDRFRELALEVAQADARSPK
jgi:DNA-binding transcriptional LysR family regulator